MNLAGPLLTAILARLAVGAALILLGAGLVPAPQNLILLLVCGAADVTILWWLLINEGDGGNLIQTPPIPAPAPSLSAPSEPAVGPAHPVPATPAVDPAPGPVKVIRGKCSWFGGPHDQGSGDATEGLALISSSPGLFLPDGPGLFRRLNSDGAHYIACRFNPRETSYAWLRVNKVKVEAVKTGKSFDDVQPVDWGPNERTGRVADLSKKLMDDLGITTDDEVIVTIPLEGTAALLPVTPSSGTPAWLAVMRQITGTHALNDNPVILGWAATIGVKYPEMKSYCAGYTHDTIAWCGLTVGYTMAMAGIRPVFGATNTDKFLWAMAWREFGTAADSPQPGDVLVFDWGNGGHHVTLYESTQGSHYRCRGGNQSHQVQVNDFPKSSCIAIRRPT